MAELEGLHRFIAVTEAARREESELAASQLEAATVEIAGRTKEHDTRQAASADSIGKLEAR